VLAQTNLETTVWGDDANPDGDARSNAKDYAADTLPQDSNPVLRVESLAEDGSLLELSWIGGVLATQYIETCSALTRATAWRGGRHQPAADCGFQCLEKPRAGENPFGSVVLKPFVNQ
jgi:hypothetical protein